MCKLKPILHKWLEDADSSTNASQNLKNGAVNFLHGANGGASGSSGATSPHGAYVDILGEQAFF